MVIFLAGLAAMLVATVASLASTRRPHMSPTDHPPIPDGSGRTDAERAAAEVAEQKGTPPTVDPGPGHDER